MDNFDSPKIIRATRMSITCLLLFLITWYNQISESAWALISIWFVMFEYSTVGGVIQKSFYRFLGTFLSALYGIFIVYFCDNNFLVNMIAFVPGVFIYSYFYMTGDRTYIGTIGAVTLTIVLLNYNQIDLAILRVFNIVLGILSALFMIRFFFPLYARDEVIKQQQRIFQFFSHTINNYLNINSKQEEIKNQFLKEEIEIQVIFSNLHKLVQEAKWETQNAPRFVEHVQLTLRHMRRFFQLLSIFICTFSSEKMHEDPYIQQKFIELKKVVDQLMLYFNGEIQQNFNLKESILQDNHLEHPILEAMKNELITISESLKNELETYQTVTGIKRSHKSNENVYPS